MHINNLIRFARFAFLLPALLLCKLSVAQAPNITYGAYSFQVNSPIAPITPTNSGGAVVAQVTTLPVTGLSHPAGMAVDASNNIYLADEFNNVIKKITPGGSVTTIAGTGSAGSSNGYGTSASFYYPAAVAIDNTGTYLYVSDYGNNIIRQITIATGQVITFAGSGSAAEGDGTGTGASFNGPIGIIVGDGGNIYVADYTGQKIRKITPAGVVVTLAGSGSQGTTDGMGASAYFDYPSGLKEDASNYLYVTDRSSDLIREVTQAGVVIKIAGNAYAENSTDGYNTLGNFYRPSDIVLDNYGNKYITDYSGNKIRKLDVNGYLSTVAGSGSAGSANGAGPSASFNGPFGIVKDGSGNLFVSDIVNNSIRKISLAGYTVTPALPAGLVMDPLTGIVSGTPTTVMAAASYTITATNASGISNNATLTLTIIPSNIVAPSNNQNYIITYTPHTAYSDITNFNGATVDQVNQTIQYVDGLGRPSQTVQWQGSANRNDVVQPIVYDQYGREATKYLSYANNPSSNNDGSFKSNAIAQQTNFYGSSTWATNVVQTPYPTSNTNFDGANRAIEEGAPGQSWQLSTSGISGSGHTVQTTYDVNGANDVILWTLNSGGNGASWGGNTYYTAGTLTITTIKDENGNNNVEYKDIDGHVVCKRAQAPGGGYLSTYYVYDDYGKLAYAIPPIPATTTYPTSFTEANTDPVFYAYIYGYHYDYRNRLIEKKIPGKTGWEFIVYNSLDQVVATQDPVQFSNNQWMFTKYDGLGRVIQTGIWDNGGTGISRASLQSIVSGQTGQLWESRATGSDYTTNNAWPTSWTTLLTANYYDDYSFPTHTYGSWTSGNLTNPTGLLTANAVTVLNPNGTYGPMLLTENFYDDLGRVIQTSKQHYQGGAQAIGNYDVVQNTYNFDNSISTNTRWHIYANVSVLAYGYTYYYDHMGRKTQSWLDIQEGSNAWLPGVLLSKEEYNEVGQLMTKHLHSTDNGNSFLQNISYNYNERGWLTNTTSPLFAMQLNYNNVGANTGPFNGNISSQDWGTPGNLNKQFYYTYDALNRLSTGTSSIGYNEEGPSGSGIVYDNLGNILNLTRTDPNTGTSNFAYNYNGSSQLQSVSGSSFAGNTYVYDNNGNMSHDARNNTDVYYNILNLPRSEPALNLSYTYDADGNKLNKSNASTSTDYIDGIQYDNNQITFFQTEEGRVLNLTGTPNFEYSLTDHLGNSRVTFDSSTGSGSPKQTDDYYPFGLEISQGTVPSLKNEYLYNKKEKQEETGMYDFGARQYDPFVARWTTIDPKAELGRRETPYGYAFDDPIRFTDPDGMWPDWLDNAANKVKSTYNSAVNTVKSALNSKYDVNFKLTVGLQVGVTAGKAVSANLNLASVKLAEAKVSSDKGKIVNSNSTFIGQSKSGATIESSAGISAVGFSKSIASTFDATFPKYGDSQVSNSVLTTTSSMSTSNLPGKSLESPEVDKGTNIFVSETNVKDDRHGQISEKTEKSITIGWAFIIAPEIKITIH